MEADDGEKGSTSPLKQSVVDYLVKLADKDELMAAVEKAMACRTALVSDYCSVTSVILSPSLLSC